MRNLDEIFLPDKQRAAFFRVAHGRSISMDMESKLGSAGLVELVACNPKRKRAKCKLTDTGERYRDYLRDKRNDRRWTRGLAIAAIIISIAALCVSALSLWLQWKSQ